jgi:hypothetical protein
LVLIVDFIHLAIATNAQFHNATKRASELTRARAEL